MRSVPVRAGPGSANTGRSTATIMPKCKGCTGTIEYVPTAQLADSDKFYGEPALSHDPVDYCDWFRDTPASQIIAYINVAEYKLKQENAK